MVARIVLVALASLLVASLPCMGQVGPTEALEITVYNQNLGLVKDHRRATLPEGRSTLALTDVAARIDPTSVHVKSVTDPDGVSILEQNYQFDLVDRSKLMRKYLGRDVKIVRYDRDGDVAEELVGTVLSAEGGVPGVVKVGDEIILNPQGTVILPALPEGLIVKPTLMWDVQAHRGGEHEIELSYLTDGLTWNADYVAVIDADDSQVDLNGWVTLTNTSGARYPDARLKLVAGDVRRITPPMGERGAAGPAGPKGDKGDTGFGEQAFFEYHLYTLGRPTTIADNETKQVELLTAPGVQVAKRFLFEPEPDRRWWYYQQTDPTKIKVMVEIENREDKGLGMPLPKGKVRVYKADPDGALQFVGEDLIDHTPKDEKIRLYIGDAFDLVGERRLMRDERLSTNSRRVQVEISLRNHKENDTVAITAVEHFWRDWTIDASSVPCVRKDAYTAEFTVTLEPGQEQTIRYTATERW